MARTSYALLLLTAVVSIQCTQPKAPAPPSDEYPVGTSPDRTYSAAIGFVTSQGYTLADNDPSTLVASTSWREAPIAELTSAATWDGDLERYARGRCRYRISVLTRGDQAVLKVNVDVEGLFFTKQSGTSGAQREEWQPQRSNGSLERALVTALSPQ